MLFKTHMSLFLNCTGHSLVTEAFTLQKGTIKVLHFFLSNQHFYFERHESEWQSFHFDWTNPSPIGYSTLSLLLNMFGYWNVSCIYTAFIWLKITSFNLFSNVIFSTSFSHHDPSEIMVLRKRLLLLSVLKSVELPYVFKEMVIKLFFFF